MKRVTAIGIIFVLAAIQTGCIISRSPTANPVSLSPGVAQTFSVRIFPTAHSYVWSVDGTVDTGATGNTYTYLLNEVLPSQHTIQVKATHALGTDSYTWTVNYVGANQAPTADAGSDQQVYADDNVKLDGSGSTDPDDNIVAYLWEQTDGPSVELSDPSAVQPDFTASVPAGTGLRFRLTVTDAGGLSATDTCIVAINSETWRMFMGDRQRTGRSPYVGPQTATLKWAADIGTYIHSSPAIGADGTVYVGEWALSEDGSFASKVRALDAISGGELWAFTTGDWIWGAPAVGTDGTVYVGSDDSNLYALDGATGDLQWAFTTGDYVEGSPAIGADGTVYFGSWDGIVYALDGATGATKWTYDTASAVMGNPAIAKDGTVYVGDLSGKVYALDGATGAELWVYVMGLPTGDQVWGGPAVGEDGTVYVGGYTSGKLYALDGITGEKKWEYAAGSALISCPAIGADGTVYIATYYTGKVIALNGGDGSFKWQFATGSYVWSSPAIGADGTLYVGEMVPQQSPPASASKVYALDGSTGAVKWQYQTGDWIESSPAISADGSVYIGGRDGKVYAFKD